MPACSSRRIVLLHLQSGDPEILLCEEATGWTLPQVAIEPGQRIAPQLAAQVQQTCGLKAVSVSSVRTDYELMELCGPQGPMPRKLHWVAIGPQVESGFRNREDFQAVRQAVAQSIAGTEHTSRGPFGSLGWFGALQRWVEEKIQTHGLHLTGGFEQFNACPTFSLIRFQTDGSAVWFKAVGEPNLREYPLTLALTQSYSRFLPAILAARAEWNGWLAREAEGPLLDECPALGAWEAAAEDFAALQIRSLDRTVPLLHCGARDLCAAALANEVEPFFEAMSEVMEQQTKVPPPRLSCERLRTLSARVEDALGVLEKRKIPDALGHMDLNPGNIVCSAAGSKFLDWAEGFVGHPFLTFEYLREHFRRPFRLDHTQEPQLLAHYLSPWRALVSERHIRCSLSVTPLVAVFACAIGHDVWRDRRKLQDLRAAGYLRSLVRRMEREANLLAEGGLTCLN